MPKHALAVDTRNSEAEQKFLNNNTPTTRDLMIKSLFDRAFAFCCLVVLSPVFVLIAILIKATSRGPIFFKQAREGLGGETFLIYKFRTMRLQHDSTEVVQATRNDKRITAVGSILRKTSLDELPQFINVIRGEMSVVGPRPHALSHTEFYSARIPLYSRRTLVKPGITGWAQINGWRGETDTLDKMVRRIEFDVFYIENWSLSFDLKIITLTAVKGWIGNNAY